VFEDVSPADWQYSGQHFHRMFVANVEEFVNGTLKKLEKEKMSVLDYLSDKQLSTCI